MRNKINLIFIIVGFCIVFGVAIVSIIDSGAEDIISSIPVSIFGAALFLAGYIKYDSNS